VNAEVVAVVPTLGAPTLRSALASLRLQGAAIDVTVVHQGEPPLPEETAALADRVLTFPQPLGFAAAVNAGLAVRRAPWAVLLNDDAELGPGWLAALLAVLQESPRLAAAQGVYLRSAAVTAAGAAEGAQPTSAHLVDGCGLGWNRWWQAVQLREGGAPPAGEPRAVFGVSATAALYRSSALEAVGLHAGPFDRELETYYEDVELAGRLRGAGYRAALVPAARAVHRGGGSAAGLGRRRAALLYGNRWLALARLLGRSLPLQAPRALLRDLLDAGRHPSRLPGIAAGWRRAAALAPRFAHGGPAQLAAAELRRLGAEGFS
jgi:GT2 family glycosyltransferase